MTPEVPFTYYDLETTFKTPFHPLSQIFHEQKFLLFELSQNLRPPPPLKRYVISKRPLEEATDLQYFLAVAYTY